VSCPMVPHPVCSAQSPQVNVVALPPAPVPVQTDPDVIFSPVPFRSLPAIGPVVVIASLLSNTSAPVGRNQRPAPSLSMALLDDVDSHATKCPESPAVIASLLQRALPSSALENSCEPEAQLPSVTKTTRI